MDRGQGAGRDGVCAAQALPPCCAGRSPPPMRPRRPRQTPRRTPGGSGPHPEHDEVAGGGVGHDGHEQAGRGNQQRVCGVQVSLIALLERAAQAEDDPSCGQGVGRTGGEVAGRGSGDRERQATEGPAGDTREGPTPQPAAPHRAGSTPQLPMHEGAEEAHGREPRTMNAAPTPRYIFSFWLRALSHLRGGMRRTGGQAVPLPHPGSPSGHIRREAPAPSAAWPPKGAPPGGPPPNPPGGPPKQGANVQKQGLNPWLNWVPAAPTEPMQAASSADGLLLLLLIHPLTSLSDDGSCGAVHAKTKRIGTAQHKQCGERGCSNKKQTGQGHSAVGHSTQAAQRLCTRQLMQCRCWPALMLKCENCNIAPSCCKELPVYTCWREMK